MDFRRDKNGTAGNGRAKSQRCSHDCRIPLQLLDELRNQLSRMEPELSRLVGLYDEIAATVGGDPTSGGSSLLEESWSANLGLPSEVDIRAAAVRLFASERFTPPWLTRRSSYKSLLRSQRDARPCLPAAADDAEPEPGNGMPAWIEPSQREELLRQYERAASICRELVGICMSLESALPMPLDVETRQLVNERMRSEAGVGLDDVSAAAARLRIRDASPVAEAESL
jgi:hypothetical protein